jgi:hypothetical protein
MKVRLFKVGTSIILGELARTEPSGRFEVENPMGLFKLNGVWRIIPISRSSILTHSVHTLSVSPDLEKIYYRFVTLQILLRNYSVVELVSLFGFDHFKGDLFPSLTLAKLRSNIRFSGVLKELESFG